MLFIPAPGAGSVWYTIAGGSVPYNRPTGGQLVVELVDEATLAVLDRITFGIEPGMAGNVVYQPLQRLATFRITIGFVGGFSGVIVYSGTTAGSNQGYGETLSVTV